MQNRAPMRCPDREETQKESKNGEMLAVRREDICGHSQTNLAMEWFKSELNK